jgi:serine protease AprX
MENADTHGAGRAPSRLDQFAVMPTPARIGAHPHFTGQGVTIALLDSGFQPHPDLTTPKNRIAAFVDANRPDALAEFGPPQPFDWHGTQTSVAAAGNGHLSGGLYRGVASDARVVLVRIGERGRISDEHIARGIEWVVANKERYRIDVVNISAGGDEPISYTSSIADQAAEEAVRRGLVVVVAAGNSGFETNHQPMPPANSPSVITVGGYDDKNGLQHGDIDLYRSSFGPTVDGLLKPEIVAPAAWVAAPVLPGTEQARRAGALAALVAASDDELAAELAERAAAAGLDASLADSTPAAIRAAIESEMQAHKLVTAHYQHVDGTSFAAPVVAAVVAQMVEANPDLKPSAIKHILLATADRLRGADVYRQGFGILDARDAVEHARRAPGGLPQAYFGLPQRVEGLVVFYFFDARARSVALAGDFNGWDPVATPLEREPNGLWVARVPVRSGGLLRYKYVVDGDRWIEDPNNWMKVEDRTGSLVSVLYLPA